jgi:hypothetical protein
VPPRAAWFINANLARPCQCFSQAGLRSGQASELSGSGTLYVCAAITGHTYQSDECVCMRWYVIQLHHGLSRVDA